MSLPCWFGHYWSSRSLNFHFALFYFQNTWKFSIEYTFFLGVWEDSWCEYVCLHGNSIDEYFWSLCVLWRRNIASLTERLLFHQWELCLYSAVPFIWFFWFIIGPLSLIYWMNVYLFSWNLVLKHSECWRAHYYCYYVLSQIYHLENMLTDDCPFVLITICIAIWMKVAIVEW